MFPIIDKLKMMVTSLSNLVSFKIIKTNKIKS